MSSDSTKEKSASSGEEYSPCQMGANRGAKKKTNLSRQKASVQQKENYNARNLRSSDRLAAHQNNTKFKNKQNSVGSARYSFRNQSGTSPEQLSYEAKPLQQLNYNFETDRSSDRSSIERKTSDHSRENCIFENKTKLVKENSLRWSDCSTKKKVNPKNSLHTSELSLEKLTLEGPSTLCSSDSFSEKQKTGQSSKQTNVIRETRSRAKCIAKRRIRTANKSYKSDKILYDERGIHIASNMDFCDCLNKDCEGCFFDCPKCGSQKCGTECRVKREFIVEQIKYEGSEVVVKSPLLD